MSIQNSLPDYQSFDEILHQQSVALTAAEMHGLISGLLCGGNRDSSWQILVHDLANDGLAFSHPLAQQLRELREITFESLDDSNFAFGLLLPDEEDNVNVYERADALAGWVNHFLLGLGVAQPKFADKKEINEIIGDLRNIGLLGYEEGDDQEELAQALEEVLEYVRVAAQLCYIVFTEPRTVLIAKNDKPTLH
ncbi:MULTISPECIES: YecA/YgfB family protein [Photorhabdus]|uniref:YecA/YgfB family protein n=1 Tax=Photorhabdus TaxID=29487 RepID=UPI0007B4D54C|nr:MULTISPECIES: YecA family protein [Photorhabdus]AXG43893.1 YecA family protein [Photorhabdus laumondii subsp. laumondii]MCC8388234.1 YecA family protein [Photorhabdus laumondii]MCT8351617.1 YecA family protein [Photorhabdus kayaii]MCZ1250093.1 YecA family protein [Photorhabdus laumondii subsp. laumondii]MDB6367303.1 YecA family protein [Photorhabdus bodei]